MNYYYKNKIIIFLIFFLCVYFSSAHTAIGSGLSRYHRMILGADTQQKISMDFKDADLRSVLKILSQQSGMNFVAAGNIANLTITLYLDNVPVQEALERILYANGLIYELVPENNIFVVKRIEKPKTEFITRIYHLKHATVPNSALAKTLKSFTERQVGCSGSSSDDDEEDEKGIVTILTNVLSQTEGSIVTSDPRTNSVIVTDIPSQFPVIERTIALIDVPIPQVLIEIEMLDISKRTSEDLGIKHADTLLSFSGATRDHLYPWNQNRIISKGFEFTDPEYQTGTINPEGLNVILQFLKTATDTRTLANPKILTLNNHPAEIQINTNEAIGATRRRIEGTAEADILPERTSTGIFLNVIPQVNTATGEITMIINPQVIDAKAGGQWYGETFKDPEKRSVTSVLRVKNGETIFLGGLKRTEKTEINTKIPILGDLPLIGRAFRHTHTNEQERELVVFLTPRIVIDAQFHPALLAEAEILPERPPQDTKQQEIDRALFFIEQKRR